MVAGMEAAADTVLRTGQTEAGGVRALRSADRLQRETVNDGQQL